jgi:AcrR family transcriptional regulator
VKTSEPPTIDADPPVASASAPPDDVVVVERPLRADARRNRQRVLEAASAAFAESGGKTQIEDIAHLAGVGVGTVCRHFPTKDALLQAVLTELYQRLLAEAQDALAEPDAGSAFVTFVLNMADLHRSNRALAEQMANHLDLPDGALALKAAIRSAITELLERAQAAGAIRDDIGPADIAVLFSGIAQAAAVASDVDATLRRRYLAIVLDGLRPIDPSPLPGEALSFEALAHLRGLS